MRVKIMALFQPLFLFVGQRNLSSQSPSLIFFQTYNKVVYPTQQKLRTSIDFPAKGSKIAKA
jgi:hypothetical protein